MGTALWRDYAYMLGLAVSVLERPDPEPHWSLVLSELARGLHASAVSLSEVHHTKRTGRVVAWKCADEVSQEYLDSLTVRHVRLGNPLVEHYATTGDRTPRSATQIRGERPWLRSESHSLARGTFGAHMLGIPLPAPVGAARGFVLHHVRDDFTEEELAYARRVQPLLVSIDAHYRARAQWCEAAARVPAGAAGSGPVRTAPAPAAAPAPAPAPAPRAERAAEQGITPRQFAVLTLLAKALPATAIAHRLHISPRTAHKHIESLYRRLGTCDRLSTVMRAQSLGLLPPPSMDC
ncbi:helix-turn-helix transcriptional regulator [Streptomyces corynorhini]|nr:LuxR C-terminal-related transcriptional regulator [Streptomyces corynorhini]